MLQGYRCFHALVTDLLMVKIACVEKNTVHSPLEIHLIQPFLFSVNIGVPVPVNSD